ncbi:P-loop containing nucleoside triphosphate hydrolase [Phytophthora cactorum]|nr:P-loop containing nucleoside triphosphate hydrolase [Phytophthora cactorum]
MGGILQKMLQAFYTKKLEVVLVGLETAVDLIPDSLLLKSGKTTLLNVMAMGHPVETCPTIGLNVKLVKKGGVQMKCWDIGGQAQYRSEWGRYTRGCDVIIYVVDANAFDQISLARKELHRLLEDRELATTPLLVLANKIDLEPHISEPELIRELNLDYIVDNPWLVIPISALRLVNIDQVIQWLMKQSGKG